MAADWTLKVEDFGRIAAAEVTVKPLTVLVGRNNSGKSYLASLIWGTELGGWRDFVAPDATLDALAREWVGRAQAADGKTASLAPDERAVFEAAWYRYVTRNLGAFGDRLFGSDLQPASLSIIAA
ncbi:MAG: hypothetical protein H6705_13325 [Myxococcales bacterium]|nr:hypothetical protein [Myxococcales bacterium]